MRLCEISLQTPAGPIKVEVFAKPGTGGFYAKSPAIQEPLEDSDLKRLLDRVTLYAAERSGSVQ